MKYFSDYIKWTLHHVWVIALSYALSMLLLLGIHGAFGFSMQDDGTFLSNTLMHLGSGIVLALGTGILQRQLLKPYIPVSFSWVWTLIIGFVFAELLAGLVLWKIGIFRGLINIFNSTNHFPEALIFAYAGLIAGILQFKLLKPHFSKAIYWLIASTLAWGILILSTYLGILAFLLGALLYGALSGFVFIMIVKSRDQHTTSPMAE